nr:MAG TPA: hypothetical protein [Microviridae sp.]
MIVNFSTISLSRFCKKINGLYIHEFLSSLDFICIHIHSVGSSFLYYATPFCDDNSFNLCKESGIVPYYVSSDSFSELIRFFSLRFPDKHFNYICYEK